MPVLQINLELTKSCVFKAKRRSNTKDSKLNCRNKLRLTVRFSNLTIKNGTALMSSPTKLRKSSSSAVLILWAKTVSLPTKKDFSLLEPFKPTVTDGSSQNAIT